MARSDLLISLVRAGATGDRKEIATMAEAIIAEERAKQRSVLADRLARALRSNGTRAGHTAPEATARVRDCLAEATPRRRLEDLFLSDLCERAVCAVRNALECGQLSGVPNFFLGYGKLRILRAGAAIFIDSTPRPAGCRPWPPAFRPRPGLHRVCGAATLAFVV